MRDSAIRLVVLYAAYTDRLSYYDDWLDAFRSHRAFRADEFNIVDPHGDARLRAKLQNCDAVVLLHSTNGDTTAYLERYVSALADRRVPLLSFVGNEVNLPGSPISGKRRVFARLRPEWIATQLLQEAGDFLFGDLAERGVVSVPHALNPSAFQAKVPSDERPIDIGTRLVRYLPHLGDNDRNRVIDLFAKIGPQRGLAVDISDERYGREGWAAFLNRCKGTVSTEAGSWFIERDDATVDAIRTYVLGRVGGFVIHNDSRLRTLAHKLPWRLRSSLRGLLWAGPLRHESAVNEQISYEEIYDRFFAGRPRPSVYGKCISSRHFDAIGTQTCQIMLRGRFNDILEADLHYLALRDDFSNLDDIVRRFADASERDRVAKSAYRHVTGAHTYVHRMSQVEAILVGAGS